MRIRHRTYIWRDLLNVFGILSSWLFNSPLRSYKHLYQLTNSMSVSYDHIVHFQETRDGCSRLSPLGEVRSAALSVWVFFKIHIVVICEGLHDELCASFDPYNIILDLSLVRHIQSFIYTQELHKATCLLSVSEKPERCQSVFGLWRHLKQHIRNMGNLICCVVFKKLVHVHCG